MDRSPTLNEAEQLLAAASQLNPGPWVDHSRYVAGAAAIIAHHHPTLDPDRAAILGLLHDIGRREGVTGMRHILDGYHFLHNLGYDAAACISLTHSFPAQNVHEAYGDWDCSPAEKQFVADFLAQHVYDDYDRLFQLCDALALPTGYCILEKRFVDVTLRYGWNDFILDKWRATLRLKEYFETAIGQPIYPLLPGIVATTFGCEMGMEVCESASCRVAECA